MKTKRRVRITITGRLSPRLLSTTFAGLTVEDAPHGTTLVGDIADQAELHGLLTRIRDLGLELESLTSEDRS